MSKALREEGGCDGADGGVEVDDPSEAAEADVEDELANAIEAAWSI